jgi:two-component system sensor histidine kinase AgrC
MNFDSNPIVSLVFNYYLIYQVLKPRFKWYFHVLLGIVLFLAMIIGFRIANKFEPYVELARYLVSATSILYSIILFKDTFRKKIFIFFMTWGISSFFRNLVNWIEHWLSPSPSTLIVHFGLLPIIYIILVVLFHLFWKQRIILMLNLFEKGNAVYACLPMFSFIVFAALFGPAHGPGDLKNFMLMILFQSLVILMYFILFSHFYSIHHRIQAETALRSSELQMHLQVKYYEEVEAGLHTNAKLIHDVRHHISALAYMADDGDLSAIKNYTKELTLLYDNRSIRRFCENKAANAVIASYFDYAEKNAIRVVHALEIPDAIEVSKYDICTLFGNIIENSLEACKRIPNDSNLYPQRFIELKTRYEPGHIIIRVKNTSPELNFDTRGRMVSSKTMLPGLGLESVRAVVDKYRGTLSYNYQDHIFELSAFLLT